MMKIGAQLYTVREYTKTLDDFAETLKKVADIGYDTVQVSGTCAFEAEWLKEQLDKNGLVCAITHTAPGRICGETEKVIAEHKGQPGATMPVLQAAQEIFGYLPEEVQIIVAEGLEIPLTEV